MAVDAAGLTVPAATDPFDPQGDVVALANSLQSSIIIPVANVTARTALQSAISWTPTPDRPLRVYRADAPTGARVEWSDGNVWRTEGESTPTTITPAANLAAPSDSTLATVRRQGNVVMVSGGQIQRASGAGTQTFNSGTTIPIASISTVGLRPAVPQVAISSAHAGSGDIASLGEVYVATDGTISWRGQTTFTLNTGPAHWIAIPPMLWVSAT